MQNMLILHVFVVPCLTGLTLWDLLATIHGGDLRARRELIFLVHRQRCLGCGVYRNGCRVALMAAMAILSARVSRSNTAPGGIQSLVVRYLRLLGTPGLEQAQPPCFQSVNPQPDYAKA